jgi:arylsulfatase A-like enzyme
MKQNPIILLAGICLTGFNISPKSAKDQKQPNIILLMADDLGWGDVGFNGNKEIKTPNLDRMSEEGIQFTRFYTSAPLCSPTRGSILTGRHPFRFGILAAHTAGLRQGEITLAEICKNNGYSTGFFGKWHLGWVQPEEVSNRGFYSPPWQHGFDESFATRSAVPLWNPTVTPGNFGSWGNKPGEPWNGSVYVHNGKKVTENLEGDDSRILMDRVIPFIEKAFDDKKPFFACVWFHAPHEPVVAGPEYLKMYEELEPEMKRHYFGCITAMDEQIGRLRKELASRGIDKKTMIWFCSDNGPADPMVEIGVGSAGPFRGHKHTIYDGGLRVPSLLVWPGTAPPGEKVDTRMCSYDYLPTIVELAGLVFKPKKNYPLDGISLKPAFTDTGMVRDTVIYSAWMRLVDNINGRAIIGEKYKLLIPEKSDVPELYDLQNDPGEKLNIIDKNPKIADAMLKQLLEWEESCRLSRDGKDYTY